MADDADAPPQPRWEGALDEEGLPHGKGTMTYPAPMSEEQEEEEKAGDVFTGTMEHGKRQGHGKYVWANGAVYEGDYAEGRKQGEGRMTYPDKGAYEGAWHDDKPHGQGCYTYPNGDTYEGGWEAGRKHGPGTYHFTSQQCQYIGTWAEGVFREGQWVQRDGSIFKGQFSASLPAEGTMFWSRSGAMQSGCYQAGGAWQPAAPPTAGRVEAVL